MKKLSLLLFLLLIPLVSSATFNVTLHSPSNATTYNADTNITFQFNATGDYNTSENMTCDLNIDEVLNQTKTFSPDTSFCGLGNTANDCIDFSSPYVDGALSGQPGVGTNWTGTSTTAISVLNEAVKVNGSSANTNEYALSSFADGDMVKINFTTTSSVDISSDVTVFSVGDTGVVVRCNANEVLYVMNGGSFVVLHSTGCKREGTHELMFVINDTANTFNAFYDGVQKGGTINFNSADVIDKIEIKSITQLTTGDLVWDNFCSGATEASCSGTQWENPLSFDAVEFTQTSSDVTHNWTASCNQSGNNASAVETWEFTINASTQDFSSLEHFDVVVPDTLVSGMTDVLLVNETVNVTTAGRYISVRGAGQTQKTAGGTNTLFLRIDVNGVTLFNNSVRSMTGSSDVGVFTLQPFNFSSVLENNTVLVYGRETGPGVVNVSSLELHTITNLNAHGELQYSIVDSPSSFTFNNVSYSEVYSFNIENQTSSRFYVDWGHTLTGTVSATPSCYLNITNGTSSANRISPHYERYLSGAGDTGSAGMSYYINNTGLDGNVSFGLWCFTDAGTINNTVNFLVVDMLSNVSKVVHANHISNSSSTVSNSYNVSAGNSTLASLPSFVVRHGSGLECSASVIFQSNGTGVQTPRFFVEYDGVEREGYERYLISDSDVGVAHFYSEGNVSGSVTVNLGVTVGVGEELKIIDESLTCFEYSSLDISQSNVPPVVAVTAPVNGSNVTGTSNVEWVVTDEGTPVCDVTLLNNDGTFNTTIANNVTSPSSTNWNALTPAAYNLMINCTDAFGLEGNDTINITVQAPPDSNITNVALTNGVCTTDVAFNLTSSFDCVGNQNCTGNFSHNTPSGCSLILGTLNSTFNIANGTSFGNNVTYSCAVTSSYNFTFNATNSGDAQQTAEFNVSCAAAGAGLNAAQAAQLNDIHREVRGMSGVIMIVALVATLLFLYAKLPRDHDGIRILCLLASLIFIVLGMGFVTQLYQDGSNANLGAVMGGGYIAALFIVGFIVVILVVYFMMKTVELLREGMLRKKFRKEKGALEQGEGNKKINI